MPAFNNYNQTEAKFDTGFNQPTPGAYVLKIVAVRTNWEEYDFNTGMRNTCTTQNDAAVIFVYDIAEGEFEGEYSRDFYLSGGAYDQNKDFLHQYKFYWGDLNNPKDAAKAKYLLDCLSAPNNPGFDALAAFQADNWRLFIGQQFGAVLNGTVKTNDSGFDNWNLKPQRKIYTANEVRNGKTTNAKGELVDLPKPKITDKRTNVSGGDSSTSAASGGQDEQVPTEAYSDVPF